MGHDICKYTARASSRVKENVFVRTPIVLGDGGTYPLPVCLFHTASIIGHGNDVCWSDAYALDCSDGQVAAVTVMAALEVP